MELTKLAGTCEDDDCPTIYATGRGTIAGQGDVMAALGAVRPGPGEAIVEIPLAWLLEAARAAG